MNLKDYFIKQKVVLSNDKIKEKLEESDITVINETVKEYEEWFDENTDATKDEYNSKKDEFNTKVQPIMSKLYAGMNESGMPGGMPGGMPDMSGMPDISGMPDMSGMPKEENKDEQTIDEID